MVEGIIVILGSSNSDTGELSSIAHERCGLAMELWKQYPRYYIVPTGGFGAHFNRSPRPHGAYIREQLVRSGVPSESVLDPVESLNTIEDALLLRPVLDKLTPARILAITSDYHLERAKFVFERIIAQEVAWYSTDTDEEGCTEDLAALRQHERRALARLVTQGIPI